MAEKISKVIVRMFRTGTGDFFVLKFVSEGKPDFNLMIDGGTWQGTRESLSPFIDELKTFVGGKINLLAITHEHKDHVNIFGLFAKEFQDDIRVEKVWLGWTEKDGTGEVEKWKTDYGNKKKALSVAAEKLSGLTQSERYRLQIGSESNGQRILENRDHYVSVINDLKNLHMDQGEKVYAGGLKGMRAVKEIIGQGKTEYLSPGDIMANIPGLPGVRFYILGPPKVYERVKMESGGKGESYPHNFNMGAGDSFAVAVLGNEDGGVMEMPFDKKFSTPLGNRLEASYRTATNEWRKIDDEWLWGSGNFALRMNSLTNNLSLAMAIELEGSGKVMLFPGDAEYGSWASWHHIPWKQKGRVKESLTEDLLNRTVFYKVAHHLSHNGTAARLGLDLMTHEDLVAMATLDYNIISPGWKNTMPNKELIEQLILQTKGRLIVMNDQDILVNKKEKVTLADKIQQGKARMTTVEDGHFSQSYVQHQLYCEYTIVLD